MSFYLAHSENTTTHETHALRKHLKATSDRAASYALHPWQVPLLRLAGLLHDLGKYQPEFQKYLRDGGRKGSVAHARWGAMLAKALRRQDVSFVIDGHHAGLPDVSIWEREHTHMGTQETERLTTLLEAMLRDTGLSQDDLLGLVGGVAPPPGKRDALIRFLFSCLTDADWLDTESHFAPEKQALRYTKTLDVERFLGLIRNKLNLLGATDNPINLLRTNARLEALEKAGMPTGFFSLNLPTGLGKTLTSFHWALQHAKANDLKRIIIVLPYVNIIDQTASQLKDILGEENVLEHHASYIAATDSEYEDTKKLACENWEYPVIVTTTVQFYETLFSNAPSKCRKLHNIGNSVVILDEVQTLNKNLVLPTLDMLRDIQETMNTSFVFCTATMPAFEKRAGFDGVENMVDLVADVGSLFAQTERVSFVPLHNLDPVPFDTLLASITASDASTLVIVNTKKLAREIFAKAHGSGHWDKVFHLSTSMCPHHRKKWIGKISAEVKDTHQRILVVATQLVEAGVDLDFPCVFRELAPLESIIQAAGRCNREGLLPHLGLVVLFQLGGAKYPDASYKTQANYTGTLLKEYTGMIASHTFFKEYYGQIHSLFITPEPVTPQRDKLNFKTVSDMYRIITASTRPVFIANYTYGDKNDDSHQAIYEQLRKKSGLGIPLLRDDFRAMQPYCVQVYDNFLRENFGTWEETKNGVLIWNGGYNQETGVDAEAQYTDLLMV